MAKILCKGGRIFDGERFFFSDVLTDGNTISKIAENITDEAEFTVDCTGKTVAPGLVDIHMHMKHISPDEWGIGTDAACLPFGVTAAVDASADEARAFVDILERQTVKGRVLIFANGNDAERVKRGVERFGKYAVGLKTSVDSQTAGVTDISHLERVIRLAEELSLPLTVHSSNPPYSMQSLIERLRAGDILTHAYHGGENTVADDGFECIQNAKTRGVIIDAGMAGHVHTDFKVFKDAIAAGAEPDVISTDVTRFSVFKRGGRYGLTMCMSIARDLGMSEEFVFRAVTSNAARAVGPEDKCGTLAVGGCADICVLDYTDEPYDLTDRFGNHVESKNGYRCILTVANGEVVYRY